MSKFKCDCDITKALCENCKKEFDIDELDVEHGLYYCPFCLPEIKKFWEEK
jgi:hypothetical protein